MHSSLSRQWNWSTWPMPHCISWTTGLWFGHRIWNSKRCIQAILCAIISALGRIASQFRQSGLVYERTYMETTRGLRNIGSVLSFPELFDLRGWHPWDRETYDKPAKQWRSYRGFRRFTEPGPRAPRGPRDRPPKMKQENNRYFWKNWQSIWKSA